jgi:hypothetical protein
MVNLAMVNLLVHVSINLLRTVNVIIIEKVIITIKVHHVPVER